MSRRKVAVKVNGRLFGTVAEWARQLGITKPAAIYRVKKAGIPKTKSGRIDFELAGRMWEAHRAQTIPPLHKRYAEYRKAKEDGLEFDFGRALRDMASGDSGDSGAPPSAADPPPDFNAGTPPAAGAAAAAEEFDDVADLAEEPRAIDEGIDRLFTEGLENLTAPEIVARLKAGTEMSPKGTAEYAGLIVKLQGDLLKLRSVTRSLVPLAEVRDFESRILTDLRSALIPIGSELRDELAGCNDPNRCQDLVDARIYGALRQVARYNPEAPQIGERQTDENVA